MKIAIISVTAFAIFTFYFTIITIAMVVELVLLSYIFFPTVLRKIKEKRPFNNLVFLSVTMPSKHS